MFTVLTKWEYSNASLACHPNNMIPHAVWLVVIVTAIETLRKMVKMRITRLYSQRSSFLFYIQAILSVYKTAFTCWETIQQVTTSLLRYTGFVIQSWLFGQVFLWCRRELQALERILENVVAWYTGTYKFYGRVPMPKTSFYLGNHRLVVVFWKFCCPQESNDSYWLFPWHQKPSCATIILFLYPSSLLAVGTDTNGQLHASGRSQDGLTVINVAQCERSIIRELARI